MKNFTDTEQKGFGLMIKHDVWINTILLCGLLIVAYITKSQALSFPSIIALFVTWSIHRMQKRELNNNTKLLFFIFSVSQNFIMLISGGLLFKLLFWQ